MSVIDGDIEVVAPRAPEGLSLVLKPRHGSRLYRIVPVRDPNQPRFWCLIVLRCTRAGAVEADEEPWMIADGLTRDGLSPALAEIQKDVSTWLGEGSRSELHGWLMQQLPDPLDVIRACGETRKRAPVPEEDWDRAGVVFTDLAAGLSAAGGAGE